MTMSCILQSSVITRCSKASEVLATHAAQKPILVEPAGNLVRATGRYQHECQMRMNVKQHSRIIAILNKFPPFLISLAQNMPGSVEAMECVPVGGLVLPRELFPFFLSIVVSCTIISIKM